jgi:hypothetical protein
VKITRKQLREFILESIRQTEPGYHMSFVPDTKNISYTAFVLDEQSHNSLLRYVPEGWKTHAHHMTLIAPTHQKGVRLPQRYIGQPASISISSIVADDRVIAAVVDLDTNVLPMSGPKFPHVTIATNPLSNGKPYMSNQLNPLESQPIEQQVLTGIIQEIKR